MPRSMKCRRSKTSVYPVLANVLLRTAFPAYPTEKEEMRPITKITVFGFRLAIVVLAFYWLAIFIGTHLPNVTVMFEGAPPVNDKVKHFTAFFFLGSLLCYVTNSRRWFRRFMLIGLAGMVYAAVDEITQNFVPGRYPDVMDFCADTAGLWTAIALYVSAKSIHHLVSSQATT